MSGDVVVLADDATGRVAAYVNTLALLPSEPAWVLVGGLAVNVRLGRTHRATNDIDAVSHDQPRLIELLVAGAVGDAERLSAAKVQLHHPEVEIDVMESTEGANLPAEPSDRAFALARRWTMVTASPVELSAVDRQRTTAEVSLQVASLPALVALKTVSLPRRRSGSYPHKVGSDMQDLYRLTEGRNFDDALAGLSVAPDELRRWVGNQLSVTFTGANLRYSAARLRRFADNVDSRSIGEEDLSVLGQLGDALIDPSS